MTTWASVADNGSLKMCKRMKQRRIVMHDKWKTPWKEKSFLVQLPFRRSCPLLRVEFLPFKSKLGLKPRLSSAPTMSHSQPASVARFFDWSEETDASCIPVSHLYREIAESVRVSTQRVTTEKTRAGRVAGTGNNAAWPPNSVRINPGRMFLREKGILTRGEREIIEGICRNRGDLRREEGKPEVKVRYHHDAWTVGKTSSGRAGPEGSRETPRETPRAIVPELPAAVGNETVRSSTNVAVNGSSSGCSQCSNNSSNNTSNSTSTGSSGSHSVVVIGPQCASCFREQQAAQQQLLHQISHTHRQLALYSFIKPPWQELLPTAPPSTPDISPSLRNSSPMTPSSVSNQHLLSSSPNKRMSRRQKRLPDRTPVLQEISISSETEANCGDSHDSKKNSKKVLVKVYLPKVSADTTDDDIRMCMQQGKPVLTRERPLSHKDFLHSYRKENREVVKQNSEPRIGKADKSAIRYQCSKSLVAMHPVKIVAPVLPKGVVPQDS